jgi:DNA-directed RNA polymerase specialized sigma24 family protein
MTEGSDEDLLAAIGSDPGALPAFYLRHIAKVTGMGVRRFEQPEDVADFVANVFLEVLRSAGGFDPGRGHAVAWLYGLGSNVAAAMCRQQARAPGRAAAEGPRVLGRG